MSDKSKPAFRWAAIAGCIALVAAGFGSSAVIGSTVQGASNSVVIGDCQGEVRQQSTIDSKSDRLARLLLRHTMVARLPLTEAAVNHLNTVQHAARPQLEPPSGCGNQS